MECLPIEVRESIYSLAIKSIYSLVIEDIKERIVYECEDSTIPVGELYNKIAETTTVYMEFRKNLNMHSCSIYDDSLDKSTEIITQVDGSVNITSMWVFDGKNVC